MKDLFLTPELIPENIKELLSSVDEPDYKQLQDLQHDVELLGYTFDFDLHCQVSNLHVKTSLEFILDRSNAETPEEIELIKSTFNKFDSLTRQVVKDMFVYNGKVYYSTHSHKPDSNIFEYDNGLTITVASSHEEMKSKLDSI